MSFTKKEKEAALLLYDELGSITKVITRLGYPSRQNMYIWIKNRNVGNKRRASADYLDIPEHRRHPSMGLKLEIIKRCFEDGEDIKSVSEDIGYSRSSIYHWRKKYLSGGTIALMSNKKHLPRGKLDEGIVNPDHHLEELRIRINDLELENDILRETIEILKKDQSSDAINLKNREKTMIIDALRNRYSLSCLLVKMHLSKSSYCYQKKVIHSIHKYKSITEEISHMFHESHETYGYRRIPGLLKRRGMVISEKIVRRIMKDSQLIVRLKKAKRYSSYQGEITSAPDNIINREFHADKPNQKMLTDITEFSIPLGKVYLSPVVDCFDGMISAWKISTNPDAKLVNDMLDEYSGKLTHGERPILHSDRGVHYRWPGWIDRMKTYGFTRSMSKKGCSPDNSACEGFFGRMKNEMFYGRDWQNVSIEDFISIINEYIVWYNAKRIKQSLNYLSPSEYRQSLNLT